MHMDLGLQGVGLVLGLALGFGLLTQVASGRHASRWLWLVSASGYFAAGLLVSEVWFGWATGRSA